jgi:hypothetical protein
LDEEEEVGYDGVERYETALADGGTDEPTGTLLSVMSKEERFEVNALTRIVTQG